MNRILAVRAFAPALLDYTALTYKPISVQGTRTFSQAVQLNSSDNKDYEINPVFYNRNPRTLEKMGLQPKRKGWKFQGPRKDYYYKLIFEISSRHTTGRVEHWTGNTVLESSTKEWSLAKHLYSKTDVCAAENVGKMLARRCLESGITRIFFDSSAEFENSDKLKAFLKAVRESGVNTNEIAEVVPEYQTGIDYDNPPEFSPKREWTDDIQPVGKVLKPS